MSTDARNSKKILIVDDDEDCAQSLAMLLKLYGHHVLIARDGLEAIESAEDFCPDVALVDITLPKLNGFSVARRLRSYSWGCRLKLIAITGWTHEEARASAERAGFDFFLVKPVDPEHLVEVVECEIQLAHPEV